VILENSQATNSQAAEVIARGGVIGFRTDTFYGLGANPFNREAVRRLKQLKGREDRKPILIVIGNRQTVTRFVVKETSAFDRLAATFWPGPLTLIGRATTQVPEEITAGSSTIGLRLPDDQIVIELIEACGGALTATSANPASAEPARSAREVFDYFGEALDLIIDGGVVTTDRPSTVVEAIEDEPRLIREGAIKWSAIQSAF
jgi:L-threonylcarbamoyladenylate synthase